MLMRARTCIVSLRLPTLTESVIVSTSAGFQPRSSTVSVGENSARRRGSLRWSCRVRLMSLEASTQNQRSSVPQSCPSPCAPMDHSTPGLPVHHQLPEFTQTHVHRVSDAIQPSYPLLPSSPPAPSPSEHQGLFQ